MEPRPSDSPLKIERRMAALFVLALALIIWLGLGPKGCYLTRLLDAQQPPR
jgi:hypothetical protein